MANNLFSQLQEPDIEYRPKHYICLKTSDKLEIDGRLDKPFWNRAPWSDDFVDIEGSKKPIPSKRTRIKMLWDDDYLYIGAELEENEIWANVTERDAVVFYDNDFEIFIDPDGDTHNYYELEINALNTLWDLMLPKPYRDGGPAINGWDVRGVKTAVYIDGEINNPEATNRKWSVEFALPWTILKECAPEGNPPTTGDFWRVNFSRVEWHVEVKDGKYVKLINPATGKSYREENWVWSPPGIIDMHYPELWGYLLFADKPCEFVLDPDELIKWELRKLYYRQRNYYAAHGSFCKDVRALMEDDGWSISPLLEVTSSLFQISAPSITGQYRLNIREDGRTWRE